MKQGQTKKNYHISAWVELNITTEVKAFSREGAIRQVEQMQGGANWETHNWGAITIEGAKLK